MNIPPFRSSDGGGSAGNSFSHHSGGGYGSHSRGSAGREGTSSSIVEGEDGEDAALIQMQVGGVGKGKSFFPLPSSPSLSPRRAPCQRAKHCD